MKILRNKLAFVYGDNTLYFMKDTSRPLGFKFSELLCIVSPYVRLPAVIRF